MAKDTCLVKGNGYQKTANATVFLQEELGDARMRCDQLLRYLNEAVELINKSAKKDHFFEVAGHLIVELPKTAFKLQEALDAVALAANRIDYDEIKQSLPPEKTDRLEQAATTDVQVKQVTPGDTMTPKQAAAKIREIVKTARIEGSVPTRELAQLVGALDSGRAKTASAEVSLEDRLEKLAAILETPVTEGKGHSRTKLAAVIRGFMVESELQAIQKQAAPASDDSVEKLFEEIKNSAIVGARAAGVHRWRQALLSLYYIVDSIGTLMVHLGSMDTAKSEGLKREIRQMLPQAAKTIEENSAYSVMASGKEACEGEDGKMGCGETMSKFEEGKPADPTENMDPEDAKAWKLEHLKNKDNFTDKDACAPLSAQEEAKRSRFEQNKPADPTQNMDPEDAMSWKEENAEHKNEFKDEKDAYDFTGM